MRAGTFDSEANDYLPHMVGAANDIVVEQVARLPMKHSSIYRKLTA